MRREGTLLSRSEAEKGSWKGKLGARLRSTKAPGAAGKG